MKDKPCEEDQSVNIVLRSEMTTDTDKDKQLEEDGWVCKYPKKEAEFYLNHTKETFMEAKNSIAKTSTLGSQDKMKDISATAEVDPSVLTTLLETCMKLLHNSRAMEVLYELINKCASKEKAPDGHHMVRKIGKHKA